MFYQIASLLLDVLGGVLGGACLLRLYMQQQRIPMSARSGNPFGLMPAIGTWDSASLLAAYLLQLAQFVVLWLLSGAAGGLVTVPILAGFGLARLAVSGLTGLLIVYAVLSWMQTGSVVADVVQRLCAPPLAPIRRLLPLVGGVDLSPLALLVLLQVVAIVLGHVQGLVLLMT